MFKNVFWKKYTSWIVGSGASLAVCCEVLDDNNFEICCEKSSNAPIASIEGPTVVRERRSTVGKPDVADAHLSEYRPQIMTVVASKPFVFSTPTKRTTTRNRQVQSNHRIVRGHLSMAFPVA